MNIAGVYGFYKNGVDKITYCYDNASPTELGVKISSFLKSTSLEEINSIFKNIILINGEDLPNEEDFNKYKDFYLRCSKDEFLFIDNLMINALTENVPISNYCAKASFNYNVVNNKQNEWYWLLYKAMGDIDAYKNSNLTHMLDASDFLSYSLNCQWGYIINLDTCKLEVYKGYQCKPQKNRYLKQPPSEITLNNKKNSNKDYLINMWLVAELDFYNSHIFLENIKSHH